MPEGDTIFRAALTLNRALAGKPVRSFRADVAQIRERDVESLKGQIVKRVESYGKHLLVHFSNGKTLHTHMRMNGAWHIYRPGERWLLPEYLMRVTIDVGDFVAVCFNAPVVRLIPSRSIPKDTQLSELGPDLLNPKGTDVAAIRHRLRSHNDEEIGSVLLNQHVMAGVGNIYKSEILFAERVNPFAKVGELENSVLDRIVVSGQKLLAKARRRSVYRRAGRPCFRCGSPIQMKRQPPHARSTYYCEVCQSGTIRK
jgi:endonuclease VIII